MGFQIRKRDANEKAIIAALTAMGARVCKVMGYTGGDYGVPDLLVGYRGRTILIEVKVPGAHQKSKRSTDRDDPAENAKGQLTPTQVEWFRDWCGGEAHVAETPEQAVSIVRGEDINAETDVVVEDGGVRISNLGMSVSWMNANQADALAGALHEQAGIARVTKKA